MRLVLARTELLDAKLRILRAQTHLICLLPAHRPMFPLSNKLDTDRPQRQRHVLLEAGICIITVLAKVALHGPPEKFDEVQLTVVLR